MEEANSKFILRGGIEALQHRRIICGWAYVKNSDDESIGDIEISARAPSGQLINKTTCSVPRPDLNSVQDQNTFGFHLDLLTPTSLEDLSTLDICVNTLHGNMDFELRFTKAFSKRVKRAKLQQTINAIINEHDALLTNAEKQTLQKVIEQAPLQSEVVHKPNELSPTLSAVGSISSDRISILGKKGYFFLYGGSNNLNKLYKKNGKTNYLIWIKVIEERIEQSRKRDIQFRQVIIPEKQTLLPHLYPLELNAPTENFELLINNLSDEISSYVVSSLDDLESAEASFKRTDTHLTSIGAKFFTQKILNSLGLDLQLDTSHKLKKYVAGDLGNKYQGPPFFEAVELLDTSHAPTLQESFDPKSGGHIGISRKWKNESAPFKHKVIVFGNSFFERGTESTGLSWWFSRLFSEFHFYWEPNCDWTLVDDEQPDIVICQTIERFLPRLPKY
jgi:hypothetical protein